MFNAKPELMSKALDIDLKVLKFIIGIFIWTVNPMKFPNVQSSAIDTADKSYRIYQFCEKQSNLLTNIPLIKY